MKKWNVLGQTRAGLFACKDIAAGDELTWNYQLDSFEGHAKMPCLCGAANCSGWIGLRPQKQSPAGEEPPQKKRKGKKKSSPKAASPTAASPPGEKDAEGSGDIEKPRRKPKYLQRVQGDQGDEALVSKDGDGEMEGDSEVSQPLVGADIQLHSFGEPLPNVWAMRATGEWDAFEAKRAEQERKREEYRENERKREEAKNRAIERKVRAHWDAQHIFACRRGCWERGLDPRGELEALRARVIAFDTPGDDANKPVLLDEKERNKMAARIKKQWSSAGLNPTIKACKERKIWPGGHVPQLRIRLTRYDTGQTLTPEDLQEYESSESESSEEELDSEEEREIAAEKERRRKELAEWKKMTPEQQAAARAKKKEEAKAERKARQEELQERMKTLRKAPPVFETTGEVDPLVDGKLPKDWLDGWSTTCGALVVKSGPKKRKIGVPLPSSEELRKWTRGAICVFWEKRWLYWEKQKLKNCQNACLALSLTNAGETFDIRLRLVTFELGGGPSLLDLDDLNDPLRAQVKKERREEKKRREAAEAAAKRAAQQEKQQAATRKAKAIEQAIADGIPETTSGTIDMLDSSGKLKAEVLKPAHLTPPDTLRGWTQASQREYWRWRWNFWTKKGMKDLQKACRKGGVWPGGHLREIRARLTKSEYAPHVLKAVEWASFHKLAGQYIEVDFDGSWWLGSVEQQLGDSLLIHWCNGEAEWMSELEVDEYRVAESPEPSAVVELVLRHVVTDVVEAAEAAEEEAKAQAAKRAEAAAQAAAKAAAKAAKKAAAKAAREEEQQRRRAEAEAERLKAAEAAAAQQRLEMEAVGCDDASLQLGAEAAAGQPEAGPQPQAADQPATEPQQPAAEPQQTEQATEQTVPAEQTAPAPESTE